MFDYEDDLPEVKTSLIQQWHESKNMVRSLVSVSLAVGAVVGAATVATLSTIERVKGWPL